MFILVLCLPGSSREAACGESTLRRETTTLDSDNPLPAVLAVALTDPRLWTTIGLSVLSVIVATVEHGWQKVSLNRLLETADGPTSRERLRRLLRYADQVESALIVLRVATLVSFMMALLALVQGTEGVSAPVILWTGGVSFLFITVFCRLLPDELGPERLQSVVRSTMPAAVMLGRVLNPPLDFARKALRRVTGHTDAAEGAMLTDEILSHVEEGEREGHIEDQQAEMIERILELRNTEVHQHMTPRTDLEVIDIALTVGEARAIAHETGRSRYPLVEDGDVDKVVGIVHVKDLLKHEKTEPVRAAARPPWFVPESKFCTDLLSEFRKQRAHLAVVLDEYGGTAGLITIEDVLEEIVGEIDDEFDDSEDTEELVILDEHHAVAAGTMHVDELNDALSINLPESDDWSTLGGYIFNTLGRLPQEGEELLHENVKLRVDRVIERRVDRVTLETA